jgi:luciferase family oxidoreductase group 1
MADDFPEQLVELFGYFTGRFPTDHPYRHIHASPGRGNRPAIWLLGSSDYSARAAGQLGLPFSFAHHFAPAGTEAAVEVYRESFRPSEDLAEPYVMLGVAAGAAETDERARYLAAPGGLGFLRLRQGRPGPYPTPEEAAAFNYTPAEREAIRAWTASHVIGDPATVEAGLRDLVARTGADELMVTTMVSPHEERVRSYELIAELAGLEPAAAQGRSTPGQVAGASPSMASLVESRLATGGPENGG